MDPTSELKAEHEAVRRTVRILRRIGQEIESAGAVTQGADLDDLLEFFTVFVDRCHHGKEEKALFPALRETGDDPGVGLLDQLIDEHQKGRVLVGEMASALERYREKEDGSAAALFARAAGAYGDLLEAHVRREDGRLLPAMEQSLSGAALSAVEQEFERIEREEVGAGRHEAFHRMLEDLEGRYPG
jgi:hemerythrin-like domain-containing protein